MFNPEKCVCAGIVTVGKNVLVAGRSKNVGMPIAMLLHTDRNHERPGGKCVHLCLCNYLSIVTCLDFSSL